MKAHKRQRQDSGDATNVLDVTGLLEGGVAGLLADKNENGQQGGIISGKVIDPALSGALETGNHRHQTGNTEKDLGGLESDANSRHGRDMENHDDEARLRIALEQHNAVAASVGVGVGADVDVVDTTGSDPASRILSSSHGTGVLGVPRTAALAVANAINGTNPAVGSRSNSGGSSIRTNLDHPQVADQSVGQRSEEAQTSDQNSQNELMVDFSFGPNGEPIDPKKVCQFCGRMFSHPGSLGRHLDLKRGNRLHPAALVDRIRGDVKRRGDPVEVKNRRAQRARLYNSREDVKQRAKLRRKEREKTESARAVARLNFIQRLGFPPQAGDDGAKVLDPTMIDTHDSSSVLAAGNGTGTGSGSGSSGTGGLVVDRTDSNSLIGSVDILSKKYRSSFAYFTLFFLQSNAWPYGNDLPSEEHYNQVSTVLATVVEPLDPETAAIYRVKLDVAYQEWAKLGDADKRAIWTLCLRRILESTLGSFSPYNIATRDTWLALEEDRILDLSSAADSPSATAVTPTTQHDPSDASPQDMAVAFASAAVTSGSPL
ncbi:hypothetical protein AWJ20_292 [Sugiyamaella lignohabitans]|uniref:C2H2-type domain-containing protein n=1 Tax=Sugiyamaella lignohabitans TaxID=796027 RepID=A0A161HI49_9ASCO|nr:uncharacterized protein AWJ20_292 [Sugiyamaella lignohabitans]ANB12057.1 hypothetical protein AWJ20_292 [Sugiyamaella lignohabitans]